MRSCKIRSCKVRGSNVVSSLISAVLTGALLVVVLWSFSGCSTKKGPRSPVEPGYLSEQDLNANLEERYGLGSIPRPEGEGPFRDVHFPYDSSTVTSEERQNIEYNIEVLRANPSIKVVLEGHCDERGTAEYNMALGEERALAVANILESYGISRSRIRTISYGEEIPLDPAHNEAAWAKNRRVHFSPYEPKE
ncbi:MAG: peptidoglycan-associated lipoprotein Pal [Candidatus Dadabacteria bacterium]|nr:MAG: peptidoglycan-associated lipoprotein Pal [Candidatus Dadabacteria bacterium]